MRFSDIPIIRSRPMFLSSDCWSEASRFSTCRIVSWAIGGAVNGKTAAYVDKGSLHNFLSTKYKNERFSQLALPGVKIGSCANRWRLPGGLSMTWSFPSGAQSLRGQRGVLPALPFPPSKPSHLLCQPLGCETMQRQFDAIAGNLDETYLHSLGLMKRHHAAQDWRVRY